MAPEELTVTDLARAAAVPSGDGVDLARYRDAIAHFATGVAVVTARDRDGDRHGMTANAVTSVSLSPVLLLVCVATNLPTHRAVRESGRFNLNLLRAAQRDLARQFAHPAADKFHGVRLRPECEVPVLADALAYFECSVHRRIVAGDHSVFIGRVEACDSHGAVGADPLLYFRSDFHELPGCRAEAGRPVAFARA